MRCTQIRIGNAVGFICTRGERRRRCSCGNWAELECDWPIKKRGQADRKWTPRIGDARVHLKQRRIYYVHEVRVHGKPMVLVAREPAGILHEPEGGIVECDWDHWFEALSATCNRAVCRRCRVSYKGRLDFCAAHGRQLATRGIWSEG